MQIMRVVLGETCTRFLPGPDGGRDGWFSGQTAGLLTAQNRLTGKFVVQCKHTSLQHKALEKSDLKKEFEKVKGIAAREPCHYILMTNRQLSAQNEDAIRSSFESTSGVQSCLVFGESWLEDTIDAHSRLLRLVPRLYGIGDLSQILSSTIQQQTTALLEDLAHSLRTFVPTDSYRRAERALHEHGFVVLVGPPASGKSAIAANLCMVNIAQDVNARVLRIEHAEQFKTTWSPADAHTLYWVDDVFGETTLDEDRLREWSAALEKVQAARKRGARIIFCTRDYILAAAERRLKKSKADTINDARVRVDVTTMANSERDTILYNHIKDGDISKEQKSALKRHLSNLARLPSFSPELARRLGSRRFHQGLKYDRQSLNAFFESPVQHFRDVIHGLSGSETAALAVCLLSNNAVIDPVPDNALSEAVLRTYGVSMSQIREAFEMLDGSLLKRTRIITTQTWQMHHPSMIEALQEELSSKSSQLILYLQSAQMPAILRDTTTLPPPPNSRLVFLPNSVYQHLINRFQFSTKTTPEPIGHYLFNRASDELILAIETACPGILDRVLCTSPDPYAEDFAPNLAVRMTNVKGANLLGEKRRLALIEALASAVDEYGWIGFLEVEGFDKVAPEFIEEFLRNELDNDFQSLGRLYEWYSQDLSFIEHIDSALEALEAHEARLIKAFSSFVGFPGKNKDKLNEVGSSLRARLHERKAEAEEEEERRADYYEDEWKESRHEERYELEQGPFADVDE